MNEISFRSELVIFTPLISKSLFSKMSGLNEEIIRGMISRGHLPTVKIGRHRLINLAQLSKEALEVERQ